MKYNFNGADIVSDKSLSATPFEMLKQRDCTFNEHHIHKMLQDRDATITHLSKMLKEAQEQIRKNRRIVIVEVEKKILGETMMMKFYTLE